MNDPLLGYLAAGKDPAHVANLNADFAARLAAMMGDAPGGVWINSGYRSVERQRQLWEEALAKYGDPEIADNWVARPGQSNHNHGGAVDLGYADEATKAWFHENAPKYGLTYPMSWEDWHIEMLPDGQGGVAPVAVAGGGAPGAGPAGGLLPPEGPVPAAPPNLASMLASGSTFSAPSRPAAPAAADVPQGTGNRVGTSDAEILALLDELQMAASRPAQNRRF